MNLLTAGTNFAPATSTGSGFFNGRSGGIFTVFSENPHRQLFIARIPKEPSWNQTASNIPTANQNEFRNLRFGRDFIENFITELLNFDTSSDTELCHNEHCCKFEIEGYANDSLPSHFYRLVTFNGNRTYSGFGEKKLIICAIMQCNDATLTSCGRIPNDELSLITFKRIKISTTFSKFGVLMMPNTLDMAMNPLTVDQFSYSEIQSNDNRTSTIELIESHSDLIAFALYGHDFESDEEFEIDFN